MTKGHLKEYLELITSQPVRNVYSIKGTVSHLVGA